VKGGNYMSEGRGREGKRAEPEKSVVPLMSVWRPAAVLVNGCEMWCGKP